jgi:transmembrane sensor
VEPRRLDGTTVLREAQEWFRELPTAGRSRRLEFARWIEYSPEHLKAYLRLIALETELAGLKAAKEFDLESVLSRVSTNVVVLPGGSKSPFRNGEVAQAWTPAPISPQRRALLFVTLFFAVIGLMLGPQLVRWHSEMLNHAELTADIGQRRSFELPDGTSIQLNTDSAVQLHYSPNRREITLLKGEAWIQVALDTKRPFGLEVGSVRVQDVGTVFTVRADAHQTTVYVIDGRVRLSTMPAKSGQIGTSSHGGESSRADPPPDPCLVEIARGEEAVVGVSPEAIPHVQRVRTLTSGEAEKKLAWMHGKLILTGEQLPEVVSEINRYHREKIVIADPELEQVRVGGIIDPATNGYRVIVRALSNSCPIDIDDSDPSLVRLRTGRTPKQCSATSW